MRRFFVASLALLALSVGSARADFFKYDLNVNVNGTPSQGTAVATIQDFGANNVRITMDLTGFNDTGSGSNVQYVPFWLFNYDAGGTGPTLTPANFSYVSGVASTGISVGSTNGGNQVKAGLFDIKFEFPTSNSGRLETGKISVYDVSGTGLKASMFNVTSVPDGNVGGGYYTAIEVRAIGSGGKSGSMAANESIAVPEPSSVLMGLMGAAGLGVLAFRRRGAIES